MVGDICIDVMTVAATVVVCGLSLALIISLYRENT